MIKKLVTKHISFLILITGSITFYLLNILLKEYFTINEYGEYGLFNSFLSIIMTFSLMGGDQLLMRTGIKDNKELIIPFKIFKAIIIIAVIFSLISSLFYYKHFNLSLNYFSLLVVVLLSSLTLLSFSVFRINDMYVAAQIQKNGWRIILVILVFLMLLSFKKITLEQVVILLIASLFGLLVYGLIKFKATNLRDNKEYKLDYRLWAGYAFSMLIMNIISYSDRFIIDRYLGKSEVGDYFYLQNFFLFPLTQVQAYVGFKELNVFKKKFFN